MATGIIRRIKQNLGYPVIKEGQVLDSLRSGFYSNVAPPTERTDDLVGAYRAHATISSAIGAISRAVSRIPIKAINDPNFAGLRQFKDQQEIRNWEDILPRLKNVAEIIDDHPILNLLSNPNPQSQLSQIDFLHAITAYLLLHGNAYVEIIGENEALWPLIDPTNMYVVPAKDGSVLGYLFRPRVGKSVSFSRGQIIHFKLFNAENPYYGLSALQALRSILLLDLRAIDYSKIYFESGATPDGVISTDQDWTPEQVRRAQALWEENHKGVQRSHRIAVLTKGAKYEVIGEGLAKLDLRNLRGYSRGEILSGLGVPPLMVSLYDDAPNRATAHIIRKAFYENTILPLVTKIEHILNITLCRNENVNLFFDVSQIEALQEDIASKATAGAQLLAQSWTPNEVRTRYWNLPATGTPEADILYVPTNLRPMMAEQLNEKKLQVKGLDDPLAGSIDGFCPALEIEIAKIAAVLAKYTSKHALKGGSSAWTLLEMTGEFNILLPEVVQALNARDLMASKSIGTTTEKVIKNILRKGMAEGKTVREVAKDIATQFDEWGQTTESWRVQLIARTEMHSAYSAGRHAAYKRSGVVQKKGWSSMVGDKRTRPWHADANGQEVGLDSPFIVMGEPLMYPGDPAGSAENVIQCRCAEYPITATRSYEKKDIIDDTIVDLDTAWDKAGDFRKELSQFFHEQKKRYLDHFHEMTRPLF